MYRTVLNSERSVRSRNVTIFHFALVGSSVTNVPSNTTIKQLIIPVNLPVTAYIYIHIDRKFSFPIIRRFYTKYDDRPIRGSIRP